MGTSERGGKLSRQQKKSPEPRLCGSEPCSGVHVFPCPPRDSSPSASMARSEAAVTPARSNPRCSLLPQASVHDVMSSFISQFIIAREGTGRQAGTKTPLGEVVTSHVYCDFVLGTLTVPLRGLQVTVAALLDTDEGGKQTGGRWPRPPVGASAPSLPRPSHLGPGVAVTKTSHEIKTVRRPGDGVWTGTGDEPPTFYGCSGQLCSPAEPRVGTGTR